MFKRICPSCWKFFTPGNNSSSNRKYCLRRACNRQTKNKILRNWHRKNPKKKSKYAREFYSKSKQRAIQLIMNTHRVQGCMYEIHPHIPLDLKERKCWGELWLEHPNGGGSHNNRILKRSVLWPHFNSGRADPKKYLILCQLHSIWNNHNYDGKSKQAS